MSKLVLYCDLDGVVADFNKYLTIAAPHLNIDKDCTDEEYDNRSKLLDEFCFTNPKIFEHFDPIDGALEAIPTLMTKYDVYFLSTPMWAIPESYMGKRIWLEKHYGKLIEKRLILSHRKDLLMGNYLIDDRLKHGVDRFMGEHIHFGTDEFPNWEMTLKYLM